MLTLGDEPFDQAAQCPGPDADLVAHPERPRHEQDNAREHIGQALLGGDADQHTGQRAADDQLRDRDVKQLQRHHNGGKAHRPGRS